MNRETTDWLVTDEPVGFEKSPVEVQDLQETYRPIQIPDEFREYDRPVGLGNN